MKPLAPLTLALAILAGCDGFVVEPEPEVDPLTLATDCPVDEAEVDVAANPECE